MFRARRPHTAAELFSSYIPDYDLSTTLTVASGLPLWYLLELSRTSGRDQRDICAREGVFVPDCWRSSVGRASDL